MGIKSKEFHFKTWSNIWNELEESDHINITYLHIWSGWMKWVFKVDKVTVIRVPQTAVNLSADSFLSHNLLCKHCHVTLHPVPLPPLVWSVVIPHSLLSLFVTWPLLCLFTESIKLQTPWKSRGIWFTDGLLLSPPRQKNAWTHGASE